MNSIYTIGFTKKSAEEFFNLIRENGITTVIDVRLNNTSQLAGYSKYPDIVFFLSEICKTKYVHDTLFAPTPELMESYKKGEMTWEEFKKRFGQIMDSRDATNHIAKNYNAEEERYCLLCSEEKAEKCHRRLVAVFFMQAKKPNTVHL